MMKHQLGYPRKNSANQQVKNKVSNKIHNQLTINNKENVIVYKTTGTMKSNKVLH